jgi:Gram-negative porin
MKALQTSVAAAALFAFAAPFAGPASAANKNVVNGKSQVHLAITGQLSRVFRVTDDGNTTNYQNTSNSFSGNRVRFIGTAKAWDSLTIGTRIEFQFNNRTSNESGNFAANGAKDEDTADDTGIDPRYQDISFAGKWGKFYLGKGDSAANGTAEADLSGTIIAANVTAGDMFGGSHFLIDNLPAGTSQDPNLNGGLSGPRASTIFRSFDALSRTQRIRYDTPTYFGTVVSAGLNQGPIPDVAVRWAGSFAGTKAVVRVGWMDRSSASATRGTQVDGSASVLHSSGLNLTVAGGVENLKGTASLGRDNPTELYFKVGYKAKLWDAGTTNFFADYAQYDDTTANGDDGTSWTVGVVQILEDYATELFAAFNVAQFDDSTANTYDDLTNGWVGARVKF